MEAKLFPLMCAAPLSPLLHPTNLPISRRKTANSSVLRSMSKAEPLLEGIPKEYYDDKIEEAAERGELTELVLMVIWNRLDLARRDTEILKREATPAMRLLNDLLNMHDGCCYRFLSGSKLFFYYEMEDLGVR